MAEDLVDRTVLERTVALVERIYDADQDESIPIEAAWKMTVREAKRHPFWPKSPMPAQTREADDGVAF